MATPLARRLPRELRSNLGKYAGIFLLMTVAIALVSGFLVAASSILRIEATVHEDYHVEDGRFTTSFEASERALAALEEQGVHVYENFSFDLPLALPDEQGAEATCTARVYQNRTEVDLAAYVEGRAPQDVGEIALDRVFCANNGLALGSVVEVAGSPYTLCGIMTLSDYQALFEHNTDFVFNALTFTVAQVTPEAFTALEEAGYGETFTYSYLFDDTGLTLAERTDRAEDLLAALARHDATVTDYCDIEANQAYAYAADDAEGDSVMWETLMLILIVIMAFVFAVLTSSTIEEESAVIGTLLASGYRKREIVGHYLAMPALVGLVACAVGNGVGYAVVIDAMRGLYYNSYSLPPFQAFWSTKVFLITTVLPFALLMGIMLVSLLRTLRATPLQFLRHEARARRGTHTFPLPRGWRFMTRFRARVLLRNLSNFITLFLGVALASLLLLFGFCMMPTIEQYAAGMKADLVSEHQYTLKAPLEIEGSAGERAGWAAAGALADDGDWAIDDTTTQGELVDRMTRLAQALTVDASAHPVNSTVLPSATVAQAEKFGAAALEYRRDGGGAEDITLYGVQGNSRYWDGLDTSAGLVISNGLAEKYGLKAGQAITLYDKYADAAYELTIAATYGSRNSIYAYLSLDAFNTLLGNEAGYFNGYVSNEALDLDERYVANDLTPAAMDAITNQMENSMGDMCQLIVGVSVVIYLVLMYLLTKTVIDRSARAISYMKVFGYRNREIDRLYLHPVSVAVAFSLVASLPLVIAAIAALLKVVFLEYAGNFTISTPPASLLTIVALGLASYAVVALLHARHIKRVPLSLALKVQE